MQKTKFKWNHRIHIPILIVISSIVILIANFIIIIEVDDQINPTNTTIFTISSEHDVFFGNSEDGNKDQRYVKIWFSPAMYEDTYGCAYLSLLEDDSNDEFVGIAIGGINSQGLCFDANEILPSSLVSYSPSLGLIASYNSFWQMILSECSSVSEVIEWYQARNMGGWWDYQIHWADKTGDAVIIGPDPYQSLAFTRKTGDYLVSTNFNLVNHSQGWYPCKRYEFVSNQLEEISGEREIDRRYLTFILKAVNVPQKGDYFGSVYSNIFELKSQAIHLYIQRDFDNEIKFDLNVELQKGAHAYSFPIIPNSTTFNRYWPLLLTFIITISMVGMGSFIHLINKNLKEKRGNLGSTNVQS
jgi:hypothetical protein